LLSYEKITYQGKWIISEYREYCITYPVLVNDGSLGLISGGYFQEPDGEWTCYDKNDLQDIDAYLKDLYFYEFPEGIDCFMRPIN
jgi:hypothetical protein